MGTVFDAVSFNTEEGLSINTSAKDVNVHYNDWLIYSGGIDRPAELLKFFAYFPSTSKGVY